jgi:hypothetical protein
VYAASKFPDTGDIEADLRTQVHAFAGLMTGTRAGRVVAELIGQGQTDPDLAAAFRERYSGPRRALAVEAMVRAQHRGQLRADVDPQIVVDQLWGACYHRLLIPDEPITDAFADGLIGNIVRGIRPLGSGHEGQACSRQRLASGRVSSRSSSISRPQTSHRP